MNERPAFIQGMYSRKGAGLARPVPFEPPGAHTVPAGAQAAIQVPLAVVEDLQPGSRIEILLAAPNSGETRVVLNIGFLEIAR
ncbi:MAG TPA: hypothetical protein VKV17_13200 [Bryobacteraceae bacterium]|nr:hypothetical protein [Bryobacteraceae bacterium]